MGGNSKIILTTLIGIMFAFFSWGGYNIVAQGNETAKLCEKIERNKGDVEEAKRRDLVILRKLDKIFENTAELKTDIEVLKHDVKSLKEDHDNGRGYIINPHPGD